MVWRFALFTALASCQCTLRLAPSTLPNAGRGVFAGRAAPAGAVLARAVVLPSRRAELSQLSAYVFAGVGEAPSQLLLGAVSLVNHGAPEQVNCELRIHQGFGELRSRRDLAAGEELFISYGASEWFTDRGLALEDAESPRPEDAGVCLSHLAGSPGSMSLTAGFRIAAKEQITTPAFLIAADVADAALLPFALPVGEALLLPSWPGRLEQAEGEANVHLEIRLDGGPLTGQVEAQSLIDSPTMRLDVVMTATREIEEGEKLVAQRCDEGCLFPAAWARNISAARLRAAEGGEAWAQFQLAQRWRQGVPDASAANTSQALAWYRRAAEQRHAPAMLQLGALLHDGSSHADPDPAAAVAWYRRAAELGSATGQFLLGLAYSNGDGVVRNISEASIWLSRAAAQGSSNFAKASKAMYNLAIAYREGLGIAQDAEQSFQWCKKAAQGDHPKAMFNLAVAYGRGDGTPADAAEAARWYREAASRGHVMAQYNLGYAYFVGAGVPQNESASAEWFVRAAEGGSSNGQFMMGVLCSQGRGLSQDLTGAAAWFAKAAEQGHSQAQFNLAAALESGAGIRRNLSAADHWYEQAAARGAKRSWWQRLRRFFHAEL
ncbi:unnamed protein product [Effrenium voratum]|uniref:SET domain-containing protein n=1 Tax=Effrenium voratum TaxID=2562239 RepID=A0AA36NMC7_9DINO|nr:unnamed protein product [Effrenium voratum]